jgi:surface carbohydrate biosynthesis protein
LINLFLPAQYSVREVDFRVLLATRLAGDRCRVFIGHRDALMRLARRVRGGFYIGKDLIKAYRPEQNRRYLKMKERGFHVVHLDEEGAVHPGDDQNIEKMFRLRLDPNTLSADDLICTWGTRQRAFYADMAPHLAHRIHATGHPRFDTLTPPLSDYFARDVEALRKRHGEFILVCTNFGRANPRNGIGRTFARPGEVFDPDAYGRAQFLAEWAHAHRMLSHMVELVFQIRKRWPDLNVVVRTHPSENRRVYDAAFSQLSGVTVSEKMSVHPWILASRLVVHNGCTTGIEAFMAKKPVLHYAPEPDGPAAKRLPAALSEVCRTQAEAMDFVGAVREGKAIRKDASPDSVALFENLAFPALEKLAQVVEGGLDEFDPRPEGPGPGEIRALALAENAYATAQQRFKKRVVADLPRDQTFEHFARLNLAPLFERAEKTLNRPVHWERLSPRLVLVQKPS